VRYYTQHAIDQITTHRQPRDQSWPRTGYHRRHVATHIVAETNQDPALLWPMVPTVGPFVAASAEIRHGQYGWQAFYVGLGVLQ